MLRWLRKATVLGAFITVSNCIGGLVATVSVPSLPPVVEVTVTGSDKIIEILDLSAFRRSLIVIRAQPTVSYRVHSGIIIEFKLARLYDSDELSGAHLSSKRAVCWRCVCYSPIPRAARRFFVV